MTEPLSPEDCDPPLAVETAEVAEIVRESLDDWKRQHYIPVERPDGTTVLQPNVSESRDSSGRLNGAGTLTAAAWLAQETQRVDYRGVGIPAEEIRRISGLRSRTLMPLNTADILLTALDRMDVLSGSAVVRENPLCCGGSTSVSLNGVAYPL